MRPRPLAALLPLLFLLAATACDGGAALPEPILRAPAAGDLPDEQVFLAEIDRSRGFRDCFIPLRDPALVPWREARGMTPGEFVLGLDLGRVQIAYPVNLLNHHEIVEHEIEGLALLACW